MENLKTSSAGTGVVAGRGKRLLASTVRLLDRFSDAGGVLAALFVIITAFSVCFEIVMRAAFNRPTSWVSEVTVYLTIASVFLALAYVTRVKRHIVVTILTGKLSELSEKWLSFLTHLLSLPVLGLYIYSSVHLVLLSHAARAKSQALEIFLWIPQSVMIIGFALLVLQVLRFTINTGAEALRGEPDSKPKIAFLSHVDKPAIVLPIFIALLAGSYYLFTLGSFLGALGTIGMLMVLLFGGMPIYLGMAFVACAGLFFFRGGLESQFALANVAYDRLDNFTVVSLPLFIVGGTLLSTGGMAERLYSFADVNLRRLPGGLAIASVGACAVFAAMCGSSVATAVTIGLVAIPAMTARNYDRKLAIGTVASAGTLGILIPPSSAMVIYALLTNTSLGELFMAGYLPGIMVAILLSLYIVLRCRRDPRYKDTTVITAREKLQSFWKALPALFGPVIVMGGIYTGIFTPTEAAAVLVLFALAAGYAYRMLTPSNIWSSLLDSVRTNGSVLVMFVTAVGLNLIIGFAKLPMMFVDWALHSGLPPLGIFLLLCAVIVLLCMFMETLPILMVTLPVMYPAMVNLGFDPIWFGIIWIVLGEIGQISPPVGVVFYALQATTGDDMGLVMRSVIPFCIVLVVALAIIIIFPAIVTWLPSTMFNY